MSPQVEPRWKDETRGWVCRVEAEGCTRTTPCRSCLGRRNRRKGARRQSDARKVIEKVTGAQSSWRGKLANEETFDHLPVRLEVKAGRSNGANSIFGWYKKAEDQAAAAKRVGDARPFMAAFAPDGLGDVLYVMRGSQLGAIVDSLSGNV